MSVIATFKVVLLGSGGVGKTTFLNRLTKGEFDGRYIATQGVKKFEYSMKTNQGTIKFDITDTAGQEIYSGTNLVDEALTQADAVIIMYDIGSRMTLYRVDDYRDWVAKSGGDAYVLTVGSKCDVVENVNKTQTPKNAIRISSRTGYHLDKPFLNVAMNLMDEPELQLLTNLQAPEA